VRGHESLLRARLAGYRPSDVFVHVLAHEPPKRGFLDAEEAIELGGFPEIDIGPADRPELLDLRCLRGARVHVLGRNEQRVRQVARRVTHFHPAEVLASGFGDLLQWRPKA